MRFHIAAFWRCPVVVAMVALTTLCGPASVSHAQSTSRPAGGNNGLQATPNDVHALILDDVDEFARESARSDGGRIRIVSRAIKPPFPFNEVVPSYNADVPDGAGLIFELRFRPTDGDPWSPWHYLGTWGEAPDHAPKILESDDGAVRIDYFASRRLFAFLQYRLTLYPSPSGSLPVARRVALAISNTTDNAALAKAHRRTIDPGPRSKWARRLPVPFRSQLTEAPEIRGEVCSPTSVAMVMAYRGVVKPTAEVAKVIFDREYDLYGNWGRAVQGAYTFGVPGYLRRFGSWDEVRQCIAEDQPVIISVRIERGDLTRTPDRRSSGHLIVITGFDGRGNVWVNDPGFTSPDDGVTKHPEEDIRRIWLDHGGVGYILERRDAANE